MSPAAHKATFFRQSGWMMFANFATGVLMFLVHGYSKVIPEGEYAVLATLLLILGWMAIPSAGLQATFAHEASAAVTEEGRRRLTGAVHGVLRLTFYVWLAMVVVLAATQGWLREALQIKNPVALWVTVLSGLLILWGPILGGVLQGQQNFLWLGVSQLVSGAGRLAFAAVAIFLVGAHTTGIMSAALLGMGASCFVLAWHSRSVWLGPKGPFDFKGWVTRMVPFTFAIGASQIMFGADLFIIQGTFPSEQAAPYGAAGALARGLVIFTGPIATVMFPKIVRSLSSAQKPDVLRLSLILTAALAVLGALALALLSPVVLWLGFNPKFGSIAPLLPWFAGAMVPLAVANLLVNDLLAHSAFRAVPVLVLVAAGYIGGLVLLQHHFSATLQALPKEISAEEHLRVLHGCFLTLVQTLGAFNGLYLLTAGGLTWLRVKKSGQPAAAP